MFHRKKQPEKSFQTEIAHSLPITAFYHKLMVNPQLAVAVPCDALLLHEGLAVALEYKAWLAHTAFPLSKIEPHQIHWLAKARNAGHIGLFLINVRHHHEKIPVNFTAGLLAADIGELQARGAKSITVADLSSRWPVMHPERKDGELVWPIMDFLHKNFAT